MSVLGAHVGPDHRGRGVWSGGLVTLLAEFGFSAAAARVALARMVRRDLLTRVREGRLVHYTLTPRTRTVLREGDRRIFSLGRAPRRDPQWTVLWHAIPEDRRLARSRLVTRLRFLGFGQVQDGTWIAPHDREREVRALLAELDVAAHAGLLLGRPGAGTDFAAFAARVWDLEGLAARYGRFVAEFDRYTDPATRESLTDREAFVLRTRLVHDFRRFAFLDPELPGHIAPVPADRAAAVRLFHELYPALAVAAQRHFDEVTSP
ncbi:PaaX family transcriptional regulator [Longimycelium tulufanense]|uniref:PaaX family transcriptional regulator n=2 Tax=Longimycelium tulufanense TaxID=907463 RepID=A0A8J3C730_9PSEU|nr:PaaX family transcriptional regulator [Longimycelium tulufanense]